MNTEAIVLNKPEQKQDAAKKSRSLLTGRGFFETRDLVTIGLFAGAAKAATLVLALVGGGMNPVTMILKSAAFSAILVVMLAKVPKLGALTLANAVAAFLGFFLMGQAMISLPSALLACLTVEILVYSAGGFKNRLWLAALAVALSELAMRLMNLIVTYLAMREQPGLVVMVAMISAMSYIGILIGLFGGFKMVKELRHAGLIQN